MLIPSKTKIVAWVLIIPGIFVFVEVFFHYYDTPFGYGNHDGLMVSLFLPLGLTPFLAGLVILLVSWWRKRRRLH